MFSIRLRGVAAFAFVFALAAGLVACDNPAEDDHADEHADAEGLVLLLGGDEVVRVEEAEVDGSLTVEAGKTTSDITVEFLDHDGDEVHAEDLDEEFSLGVEVQGDDIVTVATATAGTWTFTLKGDEAGDTAIRVQLLHEGHADFTTPDISVTVTAAE